MFDIVIPVGPNDINIINHTITQAKKNIIGYRTIYLITHDPNLTVEGCITVPETSFPFTDKVLKDFKVAPSRSGWYLQQLLKLYASSCIESILDNYLVIDADTMFLKPTHFFDENGLPLYAFGSEYHEPYFTHMRKLHPTLSKQTSLSGICHHMLFQRHVVAGLFSLVEANTNKPFWMSFMDNISDTENSGASEYEIYFNYLHLYNNDKFRIRNLQWSNVTTINCSETSGNDYVSCHWYMQ